MIFKSFLHCLKCLTGIDKPVTQTTFNEQKAMHKYLKNSKIIVEIGVFEGFNTKEFALNSPADAIVYAIDPFFKGSMGLSYGEIIACNNWKKNKVTNKIKVIKGLSWNVYNQIGESFDFLFIDGDHLFEGVKRDFDLYSNKLSDHGVIAFHDARLFDNGWTSEDWGPVMLIERIIKHSHEWKIIEEVDSTVFIQRSNNLT